MHRSRVDLLTWFAGAEEILRFYAFEGVGSKLTGHSFKDKLQISYVAAVRLKAALMKDLSQTGGGMFGKCICTGEVIVPVNIVPNSREHLLWLWRKVLQ